MLALNTFDFIFIPLMFSLFLMLTFPMFIFSLTLISLILFIKNDLLTTTLTQPPFNLLFILFSCFFFRGIIHLIEVSIGFSSCYSLYHLTSFSGSSNLMYFFTFVIFFGLALYIITVVIPLEIERGKVDEEPLNNLKLLVSSLWLHYYWPPFYS